MCAKQLLYLSFCPELFTSPISSYHAFTITLFFPCLFKCIVVCPFERLSIEPSTLHAGVLTFLHSCAENVDQSLPYCYAVLHPYALSESPSCTVGSVCFLPGSRISFDPCQPIFAIEALFPTLRLSD
ncbi:unnamed protein product [Protopolystoma xenopodis]|uniref:Uncharacterized protein n=1 Tax=Protopolystoma xenopodis TaxID=117903 RepID=A0A3S5CIG7_9PLAT|nr:unnamed protein product [Protopolystoma xenopodis]